MYRLKNNKNIFWFEDEAMANTGLVRHGFSTRRGGVSPAPYTSLNMGLAGGDDPANVRENRDRFLRAFGISPGEAVSLRFIHSCKVVPVTRSNSGQGFHTYKDVVAEADSMHTDDSRVALFLTFADCTPVLFLDPVHRAVGAAHAGWRGTAAGIVMEMVREMQEAYGSNPKDLIVCVGPSIDQDHFEVGREVFEAVSTHTVRLDRLLRPNSRGKWQFDIWQANVDQLLSSGVRPENITVVTQSTFLRDDLFFSHRRRLGGQTGRMGAFIMLNDKGHA